MKKALTITATILVVLAMLLAAGMAYLIFTGRGFSLSMDSTATLMNRVTITAADVDALDLTYRSDSLTLKPTSGDEIILEEYSTHPQDNKPADVLHSNGTLHITQGDRTPGWFVFVNYTYAVLYVPQDWYGSLTAETSSGALRSEHSWSFTEISLTAKSGSIRFAGLESAGDVHIQASSGAISTGDVTATGSIYMECNSGSVRPENLTAREITVKGTSGSINVQGAVADKIVMECSSGSLRVQNLEGSFDLRTTSGSLHAENVKGQGSAQCNSGSLRVQMLEVTGDLDMTTTSGSLRLYVPSGDSFTFEGKTSSGSLKTDFDSSLHYNDKGNQCSGTVGGTPLYNVSCTASSGSLRVEM